ncbi:MAG: hypothetical protein AAF533_19805 [Acidobacteriota bacterium]
MGRLSKTARRLLFASLLACLPGGAVLASPELTIERGLGGVRRVGSCLPVDVELQSDTDWSGVLTIRRDDSNESWQLPLEIGAGGRKRYQWILRADDGGLEWSLGDGFRSIEGDGLDIYSNLTVYVGREAGWSTLDDPRDTTVAFVPLDRAPKHASGWEAADLIIVSSRDLLALGPDVQRALADRCLLGATLLVHGDELSGLPDWLLGGRPLSRAVIELDSRRVPAMTLAPDPAGSPLRLDGEALPWATWRPTGAGRLVLFGTDLNSPALRSELDTPAWTELLITPGHHADFHVHARSDYWTHVARRLPERPHSTSSQGRLLGLLLFACGAVGVGVMRWFRRRETAPTATTAVLTLAALALPVLLASFQPAEEQPTEHGELIVEEHFPEAGRSWVSRHHVWNGHSTTAHALEPDEIGVLRWGSNLPGGIGRNADPDASEVVWDIARREVSGGPPRTYFTPVFRSESWIDGPRQETAADVRQWLEGRSNNGTAELPPPAGLAPTPEEAWLRQVVESCALEWPTFVIDVKTGFRRDGTLAQLVLVRHPESMSTP